MGFFEPFSSHSPVPRRSPLANLIESNWGKTRHQHWHGSEKMMRVDPVQTCSNQSYPTLYTVVICISIYLPSTTPRVNRGKPRFTIVPGRAPLRWEGSAPSPVSLPGCWLKEWSQLSVPPESDTWTVWAMGLSWLDPNGICSFKFHHIFHQMFMTFCAEAMDSKL